MEMYYFAPMMRELQWGGWQAKVRYGFAGHGANSYAYSYQLIARQLAITLQIGGSGYYSDDERTLTSWQEAMVEAQALYETARDVTLAPANDAILVVAISDLRGVSRARLRTWDHLVSHARDEADLINWEGGHASLKETFCGRGSDPRAIPMTARALALSGEWKRPRRVNLPQSPGKNLPNLWWVKSA